MVFIFSLRIFSSNQGEKALFQVRNVDILGSQETAVILIPGDRNKTWHAPWRLFERPGFEDIVGIFRSAHLPGRIGNGAKGIVSPYIIRIVIGWK
jgi:hypothetical protein